MPSLPRLLALTLLAISPVLRAAPEEKPNIIVIYADDLGYGDLGCYGHPTIATPNLDRMATEGMRFTDFYSAAEVCTPSRAALMTGRYPIRNGMCSSKKRVLFPESLSGLLPKEVTLARTLKDAGYATACVGKWHLGHLKPHLPTSHGFDSYFGIPYSNDMDRTAQAPKGKEAFHPAKNEYFAPPLMRNEEVLERGPDQTQLTRRYTEETLKILDERMAEPDKPFFIYLAHSMPHVPLFASKDFEGKSRRGLFGDVVEEVDWSVGRVLEALRERKLDTKTLVVFSSDNGPWLIFNEQGGTAGMLRDGKGSTWEGGMREPGLFWWPGTIPAGSICRELASTMDVFTTCTLLGGGQVPSDRVIDGKDIRPLLLGTGSVERDAFFYYRGDVLYAARVGPWKAHWLTQTGYGAKGPDKHEPPLLFDLGADPGESWDVAADHPDVLEQIEKVTAAHRQTVEPVESELEKTAAR